MKHLYGKNRPAQAGIPVGETGIPARRDRTKNVPPPYKQYAIKTIETCTCRDPWHRPVPVNVPSPLSYKQALRFFNLANSYLCEKHTSAKLLYRRTSNRCTVLNSVGCNDTVNSSSTNGAPSPSSFEILSACCTATRMTCNTMHNSSIFGSCKTYCTILIIARRSWTAYRKC